MSPQLATHTAVVVHAHVAARVGKEVQFCVSGHMCMLALCTSHGNAINSLSFVVLRSGMGNQTLDLFICPLLQSWSEPTF